MKIPLLAVIASVLTAEATANTTPAENVYVDTLIAVESLRRSLPNSRKGYTPSFQNCPANRPVVRSAAALSPNETQWLQQRRNKTVTPLRNLLNRLDIEGFNAGQYIDTHSDNASALPNIGIAVSGGGWRALMNGAGAIKAFDSRTVNNTGEGKLGGLLQSATYLSGLSGGSWLVGSIYINNFTTIGALQADSSGSVYEFGNSVFQGPEEGGIQIFNTAEYYADLVSDVNGKADAGFDTSLTDLWGRALSYQLINATGGGAAYTWSSIGISQPFISADTPYPIIIADSRAPDERLISANTTIFEFNPFEMGTWDPTAFGFVPLNHLGTNFTGGRVPSGDQCVVGFDNAGYLMGTSSTLFNQFILQLNNTDIPDSLRNLLGGLLEDLDQSNNDIADYTPNPFYRYNPETNPGADSTRLTLVDGGEDLQNIPLHPLIQPTRNVDIIFAVDSSADTTYFWPNGTSLVATYERSISDMANGTAFPTVPDVNTFVNLGLNTRPTFFGCDTSNFTGGTTPPLVVYLPNSPYVSFSNISTFQFSTNNTQRDAIIANGFNVANMGNGTRDETWPTCVACAILSRSLERTDTEVPQACTQCFDRFCWDGTVNATQPREYDPTPIFHAVSLESKGTRSLPGWAALGAAVVLGYHAL
ncbi:lysophospholipase [Cladophialophora yegresii CBS 114405]|uniref:Lysophospholipase n=1 Tax=Cladophialophora yegresii CBS 114405 TaxID=1182544 RepID=W9WBB1_9EURO|nr:lysophospholipase [Cladophialophora yegresii CBS 114405]EXJ65372.1 lysophospholipase [Cladophialophora yegresii CBS 114405]